MNINPNKWSCLPTAFANVIGVPLGHLIQKIGHDGSEKIARWNGERRGFHSQELIDVLESMGWAVISIEVDPHLDQGHGYATLPVMDYKEDRLFRHMDLTNGVLCGILVKEDIGHAVAWIDGKIHDPRGAGLVREREDFLFKDYKPFAYHKVRSV